MLKPNEEKSFSLLNPMLVDGVYYIPSKALIPGLHKIVLKSDAVFAIFDDTGSSPRLFSQELGVFHRDTRYLGTWELTINGEALSPLNCQIAKDMSSCSFLMTNRDMVSIDHGGRIPRDILAVRRLIALQGHRMVEEVEIKNYDTQAHCLKLERRAASNFDDIFEVRGMKRNRRGKLLDPQQSVDSCTVTLSYQGLNGATYSCRICLPEAMRHLSIDRHEVTIEHQLRLEPKGSVRYVCDVHFEQAARSESPVSIHDPLEQPGDLGGVKTVASTLQVPIITTSCSLLNRALATAGADILTLMTKHGDTSYPDAGIPWYCAPFGRDGMITAYQMLPWCPDIAAGVIDYSFRRLATHVDAFTDAEPGKVFHEMRFGEMAQQREVPFIPYYGSVDATPLALILLGEYASWTGNLEAVRSWWEHATLALEWIRANIAKSSLGFLTYQASSTTGLRNQGWKDSHDAIMHGDGTLAEGPIALCEAQGYAYRALITMAKLARQLQICCAEATLWEAEATSLRDRFNRHFWDPQQRMIVLALDGHDRPCRVASSNQGQVLWSGLPSEANAESVASILFSDAMFSGHGIRTLASTEIAYNPLSYHNGSIWPHDNSLIAEGLRYYDRRTDLMRLATSLIAQQACDHRLPELFCGFHKRVDSEPVPYDVACKPQAWAAGALFLILKALLGMQMRPQTRELMFKLPVMPEHLDYIEVRNLPVHEGTIDFIARRGSLTSTIEVLRKTNPHSRVIAIT